MSRNDNNIVNFNKDKKPKKKSLSNGAGGYDRALKSQKNGSPSGSAVRWYHYLQVILVLGLVAWMMQTCG